MIHYQGLYWHTPATVLAAAVDLSVVQNQVPETVLEVTAVYICTPPAV